MNKLTLKALAVAVILATAVSCNNDNDRRVENLGESEWRYSLESRVEVPFDKQSLALNGNSATFKNNGAEIKIIKISMPKDVNKIIYKVESSTDNFKKDIRTQFLNTKTAGVAEEFESVVGANQNSVGFVKTVKNRYIECYVDSTDPDWRVTIVSATSTQNKRMKAEILDIELFDIVALDKEEIIGLNYDDSAWKVTGIPHCYNDMDTFLNISNAEAHTWQGDAWYRHRFEVAEADSAKRFILEFQGVSVAAAVYVNGHPYIGQSAVPQPDAVTNIGCSLPFALDITDQIKPGEQNILAVRVSNASNSFYTAPGFGVYTGFGMGWGGINAPVYMHVLNKVHVAPNVYSIDGDKGVYIATTGLNDDCATVRADIEVCNDDKSPVLGELTTKIYDHKGRFVAQNKAQFEIAAEAKHFEELTFNIDNPTLWYPNNSPYGEPALYRLENRVSVDGKVVDISSTQFGIRTVEWDDNYCYINGKQHFLQGFGYRNVYPALGSAVPAEIQWRDVKYMADAGANVLRVGHIPATSTMLEACDAYGIMVIENSGDNEWVLMGEPANTYKYEYDCRMMTTQRNHPSIIVWESNNGIARGKDVYGPERTLEAARKVDYLAPRLIHNRDCYPHATNWNPKDRIMVGYTNRYIKVEGSPSINTEVYGAVWNGQSSHCSPRFDFENEKELTRWYVQEYVDDMKDRACGWIDWMLAETQGEGYTIYLNGKHHQKSLGSSSMDGNRFPKLKYNVYKNALWHDFEAQPGVALQTNWNVDGIVDIDAWSNCPEVELFVGSKSYGRRTPDQLTKRATWNEVEASPEDLKVVGYNTDSKAVCKDIRKRAGEPYAIRLTIEEPIKHPNGKEFNARANGSDAMLITAEIVDRNGVLCNLADNNITFSVEGEGDYCGSYNFYIDPQHGLGYHAPGDYELQAEGGLMKIAIRSTFTAGNITVKAEAEGLQAGEISYKTIEI